MRVGATPPLPPSDLTAASLSHDSATVQWRVPVRVYGPEWYRVMYGPSPSNLSKIANVSNITDTMFSVRLTGLTTLTMYYYRVEAINRANSTLSPILSFNTTNMRESCIEGGAGRGGGSTFT